LVVPPDLFTDMFERIVRDRYLPIEEVTGVQNAFEEGEFLINLFQGDYDAFSPTLAKPEKLLCDILNAGRDHDDRAYSPSELWGAHTQDATYWSPRDYWSVFGSAARKYGLALVIHRRARGIRGGRDVGDAVSILTKAARDVERTIPAGTKLWRARLGTGHERKDMGAPPATHATSGRANFAGQPVLYACLDRQTAYHEVRPSIGDLVTVRRLVTKRDLIICDLRRKYEACTPFVQSDVGYARYLEISSRNQIRQQIGGEFAEPVRRGDEAAGYLPTQVFAALLRRLGFDGLMFSSSQRPTGENFILFDPGDAEITRFVSEFKVNEVKYAARIMPRRRKAMRAA
jgi:hypothetical protein